MARTLSSQFLGAQHAVDIIPHTAILAFGKEYYFGMGIQSCSPHEFRISRGIHPIEIQLLGHTTQTREQFELWCHEQSRNGKFNALAYDFFHKNCNNFSEEAAKSGLGLSAGVPSYILELPSKFLSSPMGRMVRPWLEQMQIMNNNTGTSSTTNTTTSFGSTNSSSPYSTAAAAAQEVATPTNPWANIQSHTSSTVSNVGVGIKTDTWTKPPTPLLDKQTALLSSDAKIVTICVDRLKSALHDEENDESGCQLLLKLSDNSFAWTHRELHLVLVSLCNIIRQEGSQYTSYALMLLRLGMLKHESNGMQCYDDYKSLMLVLSQTIQLMAKLVHDENDTSAANRAMAWCVLSNAIGSSAPHNWHVAAFTLGDSEEDDFGGSGDHDRSACGFSFNQILDRALNDCDSSKDSSSNTSQSSLRQSAVAFLYNSSRYLTIDGDVGTSKFEGGDDVDEAIELSESMVSILLGCVEHLQTENDATTMLRLYMTVGQMLISRSYGKTATNLLCDLGMMNEEDIRRGKERGGTVVEGLANEVAALLRGNSL